MYENPNAGMYSPTGQSYTPPTPPTPAVSSNVATTGQQQADQAVSSTVGGSWQNWGSGPWAQPWQQAQSNPQTFTMPTGDTASQQYNNIIAQMRSAQQNGTWGPGMFTQILSNQGIPAPMSQLLWNSMSPGGFQPFSTSNGANGAQWTQFEQAAANAYNKNLQSGMYNPGMQMRAPSNGGYGYQGSAPGQFNPGNPPPPWIASQLEQMGWTPPAQGQTSQTGISPMSQGAPPWAQALSGGYSLPAFIGQGSIPFAGAAQWNSFMPQEQQAILSSAQSMGIDPGAYRQQMYAGFPEWGAAQSTGYQGY